MVRLQRRVVPRKTNDIGERNKQKLRWINLSLSRLCLSSMVQGRSPVHVNSELHYLTWVNWSQRRLAWHHSETQKVWDNEGPNRPTVPGLFQVILSSAGVWTQVLEAVGVLAVIANGLVIGVSSDFIPRLVYRYHYGPCANGITSTQSGISPKEEHQAPKSCAPSHVVLFGVCCSCMQGYINNTLSRALITHQAVSLDFSSDQMVTNRGFNVSQCR